jgi:hypothetical protein
MPQPAMMQTFPKRVFFVFCFQKLKIETHLASEAEKQYLFLSFLEIVFTKRGVKYCSYNNENKPYTNKLLCRPNLCS